MAVNINLVTFNGKTVTPKTDGIIQDAAIGQCGIFDGCTVTANGNIINIQGGYGIIRGRFFELDDSSMSVTLPSASTHVGRLYLRLDLSNTSLPIQMLVTTATSRSGLPDLIQNDNANFESGIWDMELAIFDVTTTAIDNLEETYHTITDNASLVSSLQTAIDTLYSKLISAPKVLVERVGNIGSPYSYNLNQDGSDHGTYLVNVRRYGRSSFDGTYWLGIISILSAGNPVKNKWAINQIATNNNSDYTVSMSGSTLTITNRLSNNYAYICITRLG